MCATYLYGFCILATPGLDVWSHSGQIKRVCQGCFPSCMVHGLSATSTEYVLDKSLVQNLKMGTFVDL